MCKVKILAIFTILFSSSSHAGFISTIYDPLDFFSPEEAPNSVEVNALNVATGISSYLIEDFEDTVFVGGFSTNASITTEIHGENIFRGAWDGMSALSTIISPGNDFTMSFFETNSIAFGISGIDHNERLSVNGFDLGEISSFVGFQDILPFNGRSVFIRIDSTSQGQLFNEVSINYPISGPQPDRIQIDHFGVKTVSVAEPPVLFLLSMFLTGLALIRKPYRAINVRYLY